jgi:leader peptidase (prepilin peptidase)/N-methyltransferase
VDLFFAAATFIFGLAFGSFLNVCIYRVPRELSVVRPRSACPGCGKAIAAYDNVPVLSWILLGGRCRYCKARISPRYLAVELLTGLLFLGCFLDFGLALAALKFAAFGFIVLALIFIDAEWKLLPDVFTFPGLAIGLAFAPFVPVDPLVQALLPETVAAALSWRLLSFSDAVSGAIVGALFIWGAGAIYYRVRGVEGMGFGDVKMMAMVGAFLGVKLTVLTLFMASLLGSVFGIAAMFWVYAKRRRRLLVRRHVSAAEAGRRAWASARVAFSRFEIPFGVFLGAAALAAVFIGSDIVRWYAGLFP